MKEIDFYNFLLESNNGELYTQRETINSLEDLTFFLISIQLKDDVFKDVNFKDNKAVFSDIFESYSPKAIVKNGRYLAQLNLVLDRFKPLKLLPYKKFTKTTYLTSLYLSKFNDLDAYKDYLKKNCFDEKSTLEFLKQFRINASLPSMYFLKTLKFFSNSSLLDIPYLDEDIKKILIDKLTLDNDNIELYKEILYISHKNNITISYLNDLIYSYWEKNNARN